MKTRKRKDLPFPALLALGTAFSLGSIFVISLSLSLISYFTGDPTSLTGAFALLSLILSGAISGFLTSRYSGDDGVLLATLSAAITAALTLVIGLIWKGGWLPLNVLLNVGVFTVTSIIGALIGKKRSKHTHKRKHAYQ